MKLLFTTLPVALLFVSCVNKGDSDVYDVANPYATPDYKSDDVNLVYDQPAAYTESNTPSYSASASSSSARSHVVKRGDTLWGISRKYGTSVSALKRANNLSSNIIVIGDTLRIP